MAQYHSNSCLVGRQWQTQDALALARIKQSQFLSFFEGWNQCTDDFRESYVCVSVACHSPLAQDWPVLWAGLSVFWLSVCFVPIDLLNEISWSKSICWMSRAPCVLMSVAWDFWMAWDSFFCVSAVPAVMPWVSGPWCELRPPLVSHIIFKPFQTIICHCHCCLLSDLMVWDLGTLGLGCPCPGSFAREDCQVKSQVQPGLPGRGSFQLQA